MPGERVVEVAALAAAPEARQVDGDAAGALEQPSSRRSSSGRRAGRATGTRRRRRGAAKTGWSSSSIVSSVTCGTAAEDSLSARADPVPRRGARRPHLRAARSASLAEADAFVPHFGGACANVAVTAARARRGRSPWPAAPATTRGAHGCATASPPRASSLDWFRLAAGSATRVAFVTVDDARRADATRSTATASPRRSRGRSAALLEAVEAPTRCSSAPTRSSARPRRRSRMAARERALELGRPVVFDPNFRLARWDDSGPGGRGRGRVRPGRVPRQVQPARGARC